MWPTLAGVIVGAVLTAVLGGVAAWYRQNRMEDAVLRLIEFELVAADFTIEATRKTLPAASFFLAVRDTTMPTDAWNLNRSVLAGMLPRETWISLLSAYREIEVIRLTLAGEIELTPDLDKASNAVHEAVSGLRAIADRRMRNPLRRLRVRDEGVVDGIP